jgi:hypothetical protein
VVSTDRECAWEASSDADWLSLGQGRTGQGDGTVTWAAAANSIVSARRGAIVVNGTRVEISQAAAACAFAIDRPRASLDAPGGRLEVVVTAQAGCTWSARSDAAWISVVSGGSGSGGGTVVVQVAANPSPQPRSGTLTIAGLVHGVDQAGMAPGSGRDLLVHRHPTVGLVRGWGRRAGGERHPIRGDLQLDGAVGRAVDRAGGWCRRDRHRAATVHRGRQSDEPGPCRHADGGRTRRDVDAGSRRHTTSAVAAATAARVHVQPDPVERVGPSGRSDRRDRGHGLGLDVRVDRAQQ